MGHDDEDENDGDGANAGKSDHEIPKDLRGPAVKKRPSARSSTTKKPAKKRGLSQDQGETFLLGQGTTVSFKTTYTFSKTNSTMDSIPHTGGW